MKILNTHMSGLASQVKGAHLMAVLTESDFGGGQAVYIGIVDFPYLKRETVEQTTQRRQALASWVAAMGTKQTYKQALAYFPNLEERSYRL